RARYDSRGRAIAVEVRLSHTLLPQRGRQLRQGHARHDPAASVRKSRTGATGDPGYFGSGTRRTDGPRRKNPAGTRPTISHGHSVRRRYRFLGPENLRPGSVAARAEHVSRNFVVQQFWRFSGAAHAGTLA